MKLVIASDIHGSALWCERLLQVVEREAPDNVLLLGDLLYHWPRNPLPEGHDAARTAQLLNSIAGSVIAVRGNCEAEVDQMVLDFPCMADYVELHDGCMRIFATHGHVYGPDNVPPLPTADAPASDAPTDDVKASSALVYGHFHVQRNEVQDGIRFVNPGSIALPKDGIHGYAVYNKGEFALRAL